MDITNYLTECVKTKTPVSFSKYGDGEYYCAIGHQGGNCDGDAYTNKKRNAIINSFKYMVDNAENAYIGLWHSESNRQFWESFVSKQVKFAKYHSIIIDQSNDIEKVELYKAIRYSDMNKIIICNELLIKSQKLLNIDHCVIIPFNNWFDTQFVYYLEQVKNLMLNDERPPLVITCCGMNAKIMISELHKINPNGIYLDFGSALDKICTKRESRGFPHTYEYLIDLFKEIIPDDWEDDKYNSIYEVANYKLGIHLPN